MSKDKYDEYYLTLTQAKNQEKRGLEAQALDTYLEITVNYKPDTDYAFERAVLLLEKKEKFQQAKEVCLLALKRIAEDDMRGNVEFYKNRLEKIEEKHKNSKKDHPQDQSFQLPAYLRKNTFLALAATYLFISLILSLPDQIAKFAFLVFLAITTLLIIDIAKNIQNQVTIKLQSIILAVSIVATLSSASLVPPPDWAKFLSFQGFSQAASDKPLESEPQEKDDSETGDATIESDDLDKLKSLLEKDLIIADYILSIEEKRLYLTVYLAAGATKDEAKGAIASLLSELNSIKGFKRPEEGDDRLGGLYKEIIASVDVFDSFGIRLMTGSSNRVSQKISWR